MSDLCKVLTKQFIVISPLLHWSLYFPLTFFSYFWYIDSVGFYLSLLVAYYLIVVYFILVRNINFFFYICQFRSKFNNYPRTFGFENRFDTYRPRVYYSKRILWLLAFFTKVTYNKVTFSVKGSRIVIVTLEWYI